MAAVSPPPRSWLFVPATQPERFAKAAKSGADRVIIDLEDAVAVEAKHDARRQLARGPLPEGVPFYVRINAFGTEWFEEDLALVASLPVAGVLLPKAEDVLHINGVAAVLAEEQCVVPIIETARGLWQVLELAMAPKVERLAFGALDFQVDTGIQCDEQSELELAYARSRIVVAARVAGIAGAIDSVSTAIADESMLTRDAQRSRRFGFAGKLCIHPKQVAAIHCAYLPSQQEIDWASGLMEVLAARPVAARGAFSYCGAMVDRPVLDRAREILAAVSARPNDSLPAAV